jgi:hypothetical protein
MKHTALTPAGSFGAAGKKLLQKSSGAGITCLNKRCLPHCSFSGRCSGQDGKFSGHDTHCRLPHAAVPQPGSG